MLCFFFLKIFLGGCLSLVQRICVFKYIDAVMNSVSIDNCPTETTALPGREHPHVARKCHLVNESCDSEMQRAVCPLVTLFHQEHQLTRACWWKTWHWAIITTAACGAAFGREKRLHLLLKCFTFCWDFQQHVCLGNCRARLSWWATTCRGNNRPSEWCQHQSNKAMPTQREKTEMG